MALKRATRTGQVLRIPLLCDPDYRARRLERLPEAEAEEKLFFETLDTKVLKTDLTNVTHVMIRGLNGSAFAEANAAAYEAMRGKEWTEAGFNMAYMTEVVRRGLLGIDGDDPGCPAPALYPIENLSGDGGYGEMWAVMLLELNARIRTWGTLGESVGSSSVPS